MITFPRPQTVHRLLIGPTPSKLVACEAAQGIVAGWCRIADTSEEAATTAILALCESFRCDTVDTVALTIRRAVWSCWNDERDSHLESLGRFSTADGCPEGCIDVCRAAALVACSVAGMVEPTDDHADVIQSWWRRLCRENKKTVVVDQGPIDLENPRNVLADMLEQMPRWPGEPTPFCRLLDAISSRMLRSKPA